MWGPFEAVTTDTAHGGVEVILRGGRVGMCVLLRMQNGT